MIIVTEQLVCSHQVDVFSFSARNVFQRAESFRRRISYWIYRHRQRPQNTVVKWALLIWSRQHFPVPVTNQFSFCRRFFRWVSHRAFPCLTSRRIIVVKRETSLSSGECSALVSRLVSVWYTLFSMSIEDLRRYRRQRRTTEVTLTALNR